MQLHRGRMADMIPFFLRTQGTPPSPRHGHGMVVVQGACSGVERLCSVFTKASFCNAPASTPFDSPVPYFRHTCLFTTEKTMVLYGGYTIQGLSSDLFLLTLADLTWSQINSVSGTRKKGEANRDCREQYTRRKG